MNKEYRLLLIDDDPAQRVLISKHILRGDRRDPSVSFVVEHATTLAEGLALLNSQTFACVLLDLGLPDAVGSETFLKLAARRFGLPVIVYTGDDDPVSERTCLEAGAQDYVVKSSLDQHTFIRSILAAISRHRFQSDLVRYGFRPEREERTEAIRVLIVEDDEDLRDHVLAMLESMRYEVKGAGSADQALRMIDDWRPDVLITDIYLPGQDGIQLASEIRRRGAFHALPIIGISSSTDDDTLLRGLASGMSDFVRKPLNLPELTLRLRNLLELKERERQLAQLNFQLNDEKGLLSRYFSDDLVDDIVSRKIQPELGGQLVDASIMFFDLRKSTALAERMDPEKFSGFLNSVFHDLMSLVFGLGGSVNKFTGDGMLVTFGCPEPRDDDAKRAIELAREINRYFAAFNDVARESFGLTESVGYGMGIASGRVFAGNVGSTRRMEYTVLGDAVNLASRLESLTKSAGFSTLIDEPTFKLAGRPDRYTRVGRVRIRGRSEVAVVYTSNE